MNVQKQQNQTPAQEQALNIQHKNQQQITQFQNQQTHPRVPNLRFDNLQIGETNQQENNISNNQFQKQDNQFLNRKPFNPQGSHRLHTPIVTSNNNILKTEPNQQQFAKPQLPQFQLSKLPQAGQNLNAGQQSIFSTEQFQSPSKNAQISVIQNENQLKFPPNQQPPQQNSQFNKVPQQLQNQNKQFFQPQNPLIQQIIEEENVASTDSSQQLLIGNNKPISNEFKNDRLNPGHQQAKDNLFINESKPQIQQFNEGTKNQNMEIQKISQVLNPIPKGQELQRNIFKPNQIYTQGAQGFQNVIAIQNQQVQSNISSPNMIYKQAPTNLFVTEKPPNQQLQQRENPNQLQIISQQQHQPGQFIFPQSQPQAKADDIIVIENQNYKKMKLLGQGSFGSVYLVENENGQQFALKIQKTIKQAEMEILQKFTKKQFKNIVNTILVSHNPNNKDYYVLMEYCEKSLQDFTLTNQLNAIECRYIVKQIALGIQEIHELGIIHRDIKPENILIFLKKDPTNENLSQRVYKICDFGLSSCKDYTKTVELGTAHYMPPEQIKGEGYDRSVDIWALGTVIFEIFTGQVMFYASKKEQIYDQILKITQEEINNKIDKQLFLHNDDYTNLVKQMIQIDSKKRPTIHQVLQHLTGQGHKTQKSHNNNYSPQHQSEPPITKIRSQSGK